MSRFEFATAGRIVFGAGTLEQAAPAAKTFGTRVLVVTGKSPERAGRLLASLQSHGLPCSTFAVPGEPTMELVRAGVQTGREHGCDLVVGFGGGSVVDAGKAMAALLTNPGDLLDYLEVIGKGKPLEHPSAPMIAIPTTAGTGAEVTRNAVIFSPEHQVKVSLRSPSMLPRVAIVDPELTYALPAPLTAFTGLDALTQLLEAFVSIGPNPLTDALCAEGIVRAARFLRRACAGNDPEARENMALASLLSGLALANAGLGAVHGFAAPIGGMFQAPHGAVCACLLPHVMEANLRALQERQSNSPALQRFETIAQMVTGNERASAEQGIQWIRHLSQELQIPNLQSYGFQSRDVPEIAQKAATASSMKGNPVSLEPGELEKVLERALQD